MYYLICTPPINERMEQFNQSIKYKKIVCGDGEEIKNWLLVDQCHKWLDDLNGLNGVCLSAVCCSALIRLSHCFHPLSASTSIPFHSFFFFDHNKCHQFFFLHTSISCRLPHSRFHICIIHNQSISQSRMPIAAVHHHHPDSRRDVQMAKQRRVAAECTSSSGTVVRQPSTIGGAMRSGNRAGNCRDHSPVNRRPTAN